MGKKTRDQFLDTAERLFADRGFYGVSLAAISEEIGLTKQALLHHFGSKEKLYGAVLARISARFEMLLTQSAQATDNPVDNLLIFMQRLHETAHDRPDEVRVLMRELLDNNHRAQTAAAWYLKPFLHHLIEMVRAVPNWSDAPTAQALALVYQWLGAINYYNISAPTLNGIFGIPQSDDMARVYPDILAALITASLAAR